MQIVPWGRLVGVRPAKQLHNLLDEGLDYDAAFASMRDRHGVSQAKFDLLWRVARLERPIIMESSRRDLFSVYVGIPFCPTRCLYCSFPSHSLKELGKLRRRFVDTLLSEIETTGRQVKKFGLRPYTIYVGGGTPTSLTASDLDRVLAALLDAFHGPLKEFTVEAGRPDTVTPEHIIVLKKYGVSRVSVNPQTMHQTTLETIGRCHTPGDVHRAVNLVRQAEIPVLNMDLIVGLPGEDESMVQESVSQVISLVPENVTLHMFSRKRASRFNEERENFSLPAAEQAASMYQAAAKLLEQKYDPYYLYRQRDILGGQENIGYCLPGKECIYNIVMIEERHLILGLGGGANSKFIRENLTLTNISTPKDVRLYLESQQDIKNKREAELAKLFKKGYQTEKVI